MTSIRRIITASFTAAMLVAAATPAAAALHTDTTVARTRTAYEQSVENALLTLHNATRADGGASYGYAHPAAPAMTAWSDIQAVARGWAQDLAESDPCGNSPLCHNIEPFSAVSYAEEYGCWTGVGENVTYRASWGSGYSPVVPADELAAAMMTAWMDSDGHRENLMRAAYDEFAIGVQIRGFDDPTYGPSWEAFAVADFRTRDADCTPEALPYFGPGAPPTDDRATTSTDTTTTDTTTADTTTTETAVIYPDPVARDVDATCSRLDSLVAFVDTLGNTHEDRIACVAGYEITLGIAPSQFGPEQLLTRGQTATFLRRTLAASGVGLGASGDRCGDAGTHDDAIETLIAAGIVPAGACNANRPVTRAEMADWVDGALAYARITAPSAADYFADDEADAHEDAINRIAAHGIVTGKGDSTYGPTETLRRDQMATFLARTLDVLLAR